MADQKEPRSTGKVLWFNDTKGFGFIRPDDGEDDLFVHHSSIKSEGYRSLSVDAAVEFSISEGNGGKTKAVDVTPIGRKDQLSGRRGEGCYYCGDLNHIARDCNSGRGYSRGDSSGDGCYNCGAAGHFARDCRRESNDGDGDGNGNGGGGGKCYNCGRFGHFARDCTGGGSRGGAGSSECYTCGGIGHLARDCPSQRRGGSRGGAGRLDGRGGCFNCGKDGHIARDCRETKLAA